MTKILLKQIKALIKAKHADFKKFAKAEGMNKLFRKKVLNQRIIFGNHFGGDYPVYFGRGR